MDSSLLSASAFLNPCHGDSPEELQYKLICASLELQKVRAEGRLQETQLWRLQELLSIMTKERDGALEECRKLQECLLLQQTPVGSPSSFMHSSSMVSSPSSSPWSLQQLEEHLNSDDFCPPVSAPAPFEPQRVLESLPQSFNEGQLSQSLFSRITPSGEEAPELFYQRFHLQILDQALCFDTPPTFDLSELQVKDERMGTASPSPVRSLSRQSSSNSTSASVERYQKGQCSMEFAETSAAMTNDMTILSPAFAVAGMANNATPSLSSIVNNVMYEASPPPSSMGNNGALIANNGLPPKPTMGSNSGTSTPNVAPSMMLSMSNNVSYVTTHASPSTSAMGNNEASMAMNVLLSTPSVSNNGASLANHALYPTPSTGNYVAPFANNTLPQTLSTGNSVASTVDNAQSATASMANNPTSSVVKNVASLMTTTIDTPSLRVPTETVATSSLPAMALSTGIMPVPKAAPSTAMHAFSACPLIAPRCNQQGNSTPTRQLHLPEPPEADPQVMLNSLPEKGKLLQAVMQAGPLLQTLLLSGPLPQWRHPPPALSTGDIPKVSLAARKLPLPQSTHMPTSGMQGAMGSPVKNNKGSSATTKRRLAIIEPCTQKKKLRKLSPSPTKQGSMLSGREEQRLAAGSLTQLAAN